MQKKTKLYTLCLILGLISLPFLCLSQGGSETNFPEIGGYRLTGESTLSDLIRYAFFVAIIAMILATLISLIYGGFQYLTSAGQPSSMALSRKRIFGSLLGLGIVLSSFLILRTINPQLLIVDVNTTAVYGGVIMLNQEAINDLGGKDLDSRTLTRYLESKITDPEDPPAHAEYVKSDITDMEDSFIGFKPSHIFFLPYSRYKATSYENKNFNDPIIERNFLDCHLRPCDITKNGQTPKSLAVWSLAEGIYLYTAEEPHQDIGKSRMFIPAGLSIDDLSRANFNDEAQSIEMRNWHEEIDEAPEQKHNFLAILHEDPYFSGQLRIFFEEISGIPGFGNLKDDNSTSLKDAWTRIVFEGLGSIEGVFGRVKKVSSLQTFEMPFTDEEWEAWQPGCKIKLCVREELEVGCVEEYVKLGPMYPDFSAAIPAQLVGEVDVDKGGETVKENLNDNVRSMEIEGDCLVVLFENAPKDNSELGDAWENETPGEHSQIFVGPGRWYNLTQEEIGRCSGWSGLSFLGTTPCASAISVFPIVQ